jgi:hypothetical protein
VLVNFRLPEVKHFNLGDLLVADSGSVGESAHFLGSRDGSTARILMSIKPYCPHLIKDRRETSRLQFMFADRGGAFGFFNSFLSCFKTLLSSRMAIETDLRKNRSVSFKGYVVTGKGHVATSTGHVATSTGK